MAEAKDPGVDPACGLIRHTSTCSLDGLAQMHPQNKHGSRALSGVRSRRKILQISATAVRTLTLTLILAVSKCDSKGGNLFHALVPYPTIEARQWEGRLPRRGSPAVEESRGIETMIAAQIGQLNQIEMMIHVVLVTSACSRAS